MTKSKSHALPIFLICTGTFTIEALFHYNMGIKKKLEKYPNIDPEIFGTKLLGFYIPHTKEFAKMLLTVIIFAGLNSVLIDFIIKKRTIKQEFKLLEKSVNRTVDGIKDGFKNGLKK